MSNSEPLVLLQRGFCCPVSVFNLVLDCERRGITLSVRGVTLDVDGNHTPEILADLKRWKHHVMAVLRYTASDEHLHDRAAVPPECGPILQVSK
ncbi:MAG: hypothetical protein Q8O42_14980 [Acidobacteriota bacterium]|nr:hypothetical protein [Acidobacteriota bacterium]